MAKKTLALSLVALTLAGCYAETPPVTMSSTFAPSEVAWSEGNGSNTVAGNAVLRTVGGDVRTCAGTPAGLIPVSTYSTERMMVLFKNTQRGYASSTPTIQETSDEWTRFNRRAICDSQGNFRFENLPDGDYYVLTSVTWGVPQSAYYTSQEGGAMFERVSLKGGVTKTVVLTNQ